MMTFLFQNNLSTNKNQKVFTFKLYKGKKCVSTLNSTAINASIVEYSRAKKVFVRNWSMT